MTDPDKQKKTTSRAKLSLSVNEYVRHIPTNTEIQRQSRRFTRKLCI